MIKPSSPERSFFLDLPVRYRQGIDERQMISATLGEGRWGRRRPRCNWRILRARRFERKSPGPVCFRKLVPSQSFICWFFGRTWDGRRPSDDPHRRGWLMGIGFFFERGHEYSCVCVHVCYILCAEHNHVDICFHGGEGPYGIPAGRVSWSIVMIWTDQGRIKRRRRSEPHFWTIC